MSYEASHSTPYGPIEGVAERVIEAVLNTVAVLKGPHGKSNTGQLVCQMYTPRAEGVSPFLCPNIPQIKECWGAVRNFTICLKKKNTKWIEGLDGEALVAMFAIDGADAEMIIKGGVKPSVVVEEEVADDGSLTCRYSVNDTGFIFHNHDCSNKITKEAYLEMVGVVRTKIAASMAELPLVTSPSVEGLYTNDVPLLNVAVAHAFSSCLNDMGFKGWLREVIKEEGGEGHKQQVWTDMKKCMCCCTDPVCKEAFGKLPNFQKIQLIKMDPNQFKDILGVARRYTDPGCVGKDRRRCDPAGRVPVPVFHVDDEGTVYLV